MGFYCVSNFATYYIVSNIETMNRSPYSAKYESLRAWLRAKRGEKNISIRALAEKLELHHSIVGKIEQGGRKIDIVEFVEYCNALDIDPHEGLDLILSGKLKSR